jgi:hypothetical protein
MQILRRCLIALAVPAAVLLGLHTIGETPISRASDTGFEWRLENSNRRLVLAADGDGNMTCSVKVKLRGELSGLTAKTSAGVPLAISIGPADRGERWVELTRDATLSESKFEWLSGGLLYLDSANGGSDLRVLDWQVFPNNKAADSQFRALWRRRLFRIGLGLLCISLVGGFLEAWDKISAKRTVFSSHQCIEMLIASIEGADAKESERMRLVLGKVVLEGAELQEAVAPLKLDFAEGYQLWIKAASRFRARLSTLIADLISSLEKLE